MRAKSKAVGWGVLCRRTFVVHADVFRADVLHLLPLNPNVNKTESRLVNDADLQANGFALNSRGAAGKWAGKPSAKRRRQPVRGLPRSDGTVEKIVVHDDASFQPKGRADDANAARVLQVVCRSIRQTHVHRR